MPLHITNQRKESDTRASRRYPTSRVEAVERRLRTNGRYRCYTEAETCDAIRERGWWAGAKINRGAAGEARARARGERSDGARASERERGESEARGQKRSRCVCTHGGDAASLWSILPSLFSAGAGAPTPPAWTRQPRSPQLDRLGSTCSREGRGRCVTIPSHSSGVMGEE